MTESLIIYLYYIISLLYDNLSLLFNNLSLLYDTIKTQRLIDIGNNMVFRHINKMSFKSRIRIYFTSFKKCLKL